MRYLFTGLIMTTLMTIGHDAFSQRIGTDVFLTAESGYISNIYLNPYVPDWDRSLVSAFSSFSPAVQVRWSDSKNSVSASGTGYFLHLFDERDGWNGAYLASTYRRRLTSSLSARLSGGVNFFSGSQYRNIQWLQAGAEWAFSPFAKMEAHLGSGWQSVTGPEEDENPDPVMIRSDSYRLSAEYWPGYRWRFRMQFFSGLSHITSPAEGFVSSVSATRFMRNRLALTLRTGLEQYSQEFRISPENGGASPADGTVQADDGSIVTLEDRFHRTTLSASYPIRNNVSATATAAGLLWFSSEDDDILTDYQVSAGIQVSFSPKRIREGEIRSLEWDQRESREKIVTVRYRGDERLYITGDFIDWEVPGVPLQKTGRNRYRTELDLPAGVYQYKIGIRDNGSLEWLEFPGEVATVSDGFGGKNGRLIIDYGE